MNRRLPLFSVVLALGTLMFLGIHAAPPVAAQQLSFGVFTISTTELEARWDFVNGADWYCVLWKGPGEDYTDASDPQNSTRVHCTSSEKSYTITGLTPGLTYGVKLEARVSQTNLNLVASNEGTGTTNASNLVFNTNLANHHTTNVDLNINDVLQKFTTGSNTLGYLVTRVDILFRSVIAGSESAVPSVSIYTDDNGSPGTLVGVFDSPSSISTANFGLTHFTSAAGVRLAAGTDYWVIVDSDAAVAHVLRNTPSASQTGLAGWSIADNQKFRSRSESGGTDGTVSDAILKVGLVGYARTTNSAPVFSPSTVTRSFFENSPSGTPIGAPVTATDADSDPLTYSLGGTDAGSFDIDAATGQLRAKSGVTYDYETRTTYSVTVTASDGAASASATVTITLIDVDEQARVGWWPQNSNVQSNLYGVHFTDANTGWAVGHNGTILRTTDGGANWTAQTSGVTKSLQSVDFVDASNGWAVGQTGTILRTTDGGANWTAQNSGTTRLLYSVDFSDASNGWVVGAGGTILHTTDGGANWNSQTSGTTGWLYSVDFVDASNGWAVGDSGTIRHTTDGGANWSAQTSGTLQGLIGVDFVDASNGWAVGNGGTILRTTDGGANWSPQNSRTTRNLTDLDFVDASNGWAVGNGGTILRTIDGGANWSPQGSRTSNSLEDVFFLNAEKGWAVGNNGTILAFGELPLLLDLSLFHQCCIYEDGGQQQFAMRIGLASKQSEDLRVSLSYDLGETAADFESFQVDDVTVPAGWTWVVTHVTTTPRNDQVVEPDKRLTVTASATINGVIHTDTQELKLIDMAPAVQEPSPSGDRRGTPLAGLTVSPVSGNPTAIDVVWDPVEGAIQYRLSGIYHNEARTTGTSYRFEHLDPETTYTVKVEAWDLDYRPAYKIAEAEASGATGSAGSLTFLAHPGAADGTTQLDLSWQAPQGVPAERYYLKWRRIIHYHQGTPVYGARTWDKRIERDGNGNLATTHTITGLRPDSVYEINIRAIDRRDNTVAEVTGLGYTLILIKDLRIIRYEEQDRMVLRWTQAANPYIRSRDYDIYWRAGSGNYALTEAVVCLGEWPYPAQCEAFMSAAIALRSGSPPDLTKRHDFRVIPVFSILQPQLQRFERYNGKPAEVSTFPRVATDLSVAGWTDTKLAVAWQGRGEHAGATVNLRPHYRIAGSDDAWTSAGWAANTGSSGYEVIGGLRPNTEYEVRVRLVDAGGKVYAESFDKGRTYRTFRDLLWVNRVPGSTDTLHVSWGKLDDVDEYFIQWAPEGAAWQGSHSVPSGTNHYTIEGLEENTLYVVAVSLILSLPPGLPWDQAASPIVEWKKARTDAPAPPPREKTPLDLATLVVDACIDDDCNTIVTRSIFFEWEGMPTVSGAEVTKYTFQMSADGETGWADTTDSGEGRCRADMAAEDGKIDGSRYDPDHPDADDDGFVPAKVAPECAVVLKDESGISAGDTRYFRVIAKSADGSQSQTGPASKIETKGAGQRGAPQQPPPTGGGAIGGAPPPDQEPTFGNQTIAAKSYTQNSAVDDTLPGATGGDGTLTYSIIGTLPTGLTFSSSTRKITGTPTATQNAANYTYRVTDSDGDTADLSLSIAVAEADGATGASDSSQSVAFVVYLPDSGDTAGQGRADQGNALIKAADLEYRTVASGDTDPDAGPPEDGARLPRWYRIDGESHDGRTWGGLRWLEAALPKDLQPTFGDRTITAKSYLQNSAVDDTLPHATGGDGNLTYSIVETLPAGLSFSSSTRKITGTPTTAQAVTTYTYQVTDGDGDQEDLTFTIAIAEDLQPTFGDQTVAAKSYTQDTTVDDTLPEATSGNGELTYSIVGTLPAGLTFNASTRKISGTPTGTQAATTYTYRVSDGDGDISDLTFSIAVAEADGATGTSEPSVAFVVYEPASGDNDATSRLTEGNKLITDAGLTYRTVAHGETDPDAGPPEDTARLPRWYRIDGVKHDDRTWGGLRWLKAALDE